MTKTLYIMGSCGTRTLGDVEIAAPGNGWPLLRESTGDSPEQHGPAVDVSSVDMTYSMMRRTSSKRSALPKIGRRLACDRFEDTIEVGQ